MTDFNENVIKYYNFTNNKNIPLIDQLVFVFDIDLFNIYILNFTHNSHKIKFIEKDYWDDNVIIYKQNNTHIGYVLILEKINSAINFMISNIKFKERIYRSIVLFVPEQQKMKNSLIKPYFRYFPYFFGEHDINIKNKNNIYQIYFHMKCLFCFGLFDYLNLEILELFYNNNTNQQNYNIIKNIT